jgi:hypothetical protein
MLAPERGSSLKDPLIGKVIEDDLLSIIRRSSPKLAARELNLHLLRTED